MSYFNYAWVQMVDLPTYSCTATCFEQTLNIRITWIERIKRRAISVTGSNGAVYLQNTVINVDEPLQFNSNALEDGYDCSIILQSTPDAPKEVDYLNWSKNMFLTVYRITEN
ncbi:hypothetical protein BRC2024_KCUCJSVR_CDS_0139 [Acinetobacter phage vB_AbaM_KissB]|uniref:hypothetical protein n=1 Tax=Acinetobacter phage vB_AbaM_phiAbaA1 TaxID=1605379 RepID=UPI00078C1C53|nr:hypothetical protein BJD49_gp141 [Acinetobacter phage vB_AbaM_phiAbaA1]AJK27149.1 hypothetical protein phiAbaA1_046 [Acinetobacter phage vB_AbaM_phiAbaA1]